MKENLLSNTPYEPKRQNRYYVEFPEEFEIELWKVQKTDKPVLYHGEWLDIEIKFLDVIGPSTSQELYGLIEILKEKKDSKTLFEFHIKLLDPTGIVVEDWLIKVEEVISIDFGKLDMDSDELQILTMIVRPYDCVLL